MKIAPNHGSGRLKLGSEKNAIKNIEQFVIDCDVGDVSWQSTPEKDSGDGRHTFVLWKDGNHVIVEMPGWELESVRYISDSQNVWDYPRLYIDGDSWVWKFAVSRARDKLPHGFSYRTKCRKARTANRLF